jgi:hypothetical protein
MPHFSEQRGRQEQRHAARPLGKDPRQDRTTVGNMRTDGLEADLLAMPVSAGPVLQDADGAFFFMFGLSAFGGSEPFEGS